MGYNYAIIGGGRQGSASAYDLGKFGEADKILIIDSDVSSSEKACTLVNSLLKSNVCKSEQCDARDTNKLVSLLSSTDAIISGVPYYFNLSLSKIAITVGANFCDFGGNTEIVKEQLKLNKQAKNNKISIIPDCGMDPGLNLSMISYLMDEYPEISSIRNYAGGLPQHPSPPWNYVSTFHINGLTNEYFGTSPFIRDHKLINVECLSEVEELKLPSPFEMLEAAVTTGGLSTLPWDLRGKLKSLENKTLRYPGHWNQFNSYKMLGLFNETPIRVENIELKPRDFFHTLLEPKLKKDSVEDVGIIKIIASFDDKNISDKELTVIDYFDEATGFTAMQRLTGWHASVMAIQAAKGKTKLGSLPVYKALDGKSVINELKRRGLTFIE